MLRRTLIMTGLAIAFAAGAAEPAFAAENTATASPAKVAETRAALRDLWSEHVLWVRNVVWAALEKNQSAGAAAEAQVVANARQIADTTTPFYGKPAADQLFELLKEHYGPIRQYLDASIANDAAGRDRAQKALSANAAAIAKFLSGANPHLPYDPVNGLLLAHGAHHVAQIDQLKSGKYAQEAQTWTAMRTHMNTIADAIGDALAKQFPAKFR